MTDTSSKTVIVRRPALEAVVVEVQKSVPLQERVRVLQEQTDSIGIIATDFDQKAFMDEMWDD